MDRFVLTPEAAKLLPNMQVVVVTAYNLSNIGSNAQVAQYSKVERITHPHTHHDTKHLAIRLTRFPQETATSTLSILSSYPNAQSHPRISLYRNTLKAACNLSAKKFPQSNESLYKRLMKEQAVLRPINPIVDFYNSVSIKYGVTAGAFDLGELQTRSIKPLELRLSTSDDTFRALDGGADAQSVKVGKGEVVYVQDSTVLTRHLAWRQAVEGLVQEQTRNVLFVSEVFNEEKATEPTELTKQVVGELVDGLKHFFGVEAHVAVLGDGLRKLETSVENAFF